MNRPLAITQRQVRAICEGARKAKHVAIVEIVDGKAVIRLVPEEHAIRSQDHGFVDRPERIDL